MNQKFIRLIIILVIILTYFIINSYHCILLKYKPIPACIVENVTNKDSTLVFLNGRNLCPTCSPGQYVYSLSRRKEIIYFVPEDFSNNDIENLRYAFDIKGKIIKRDIKINNFLEKISSCTKVKDLRENFCLGLGENNKVKEIKTF
jgi:hypothetical protein